MKLSPRSSRWSRDHDVDTDEQVGENAEVSADAMVLSDCTSIRRGTLRDRWDLVHLDTDRTRPIGRHSTAFDTATAPADAGEHPRAVNPRALTRCPRTVAG